MIEDPIPAKATGKVELKVKAASYATFAFLLVAQTFLASTATDYVSALPDWLEVSAYSILGTAVTFLAGYARKSQPDSLSASTITAAQTWLKAHLPRRTQ